MCIRFDQNLTKYHRQQLNSDLALVSNVLLILLQQHLVLNPHAKNLTHHYQHPSQLQLHHRLPKLPHKQSCSLLTQKRNDRLRHSPRRFPTDLIGPLKSALFEGTIPRTGYSAPLPMFNVAVIFHAHLPVSGSIGANTLPVADDVQSALKLPSRMFILDP